MQDICHMTRTSFVLAYLPCIRHWRSQPRKLTNGEYKTSSEEGYGRICPIGEVSDGYKLLVRSFLIGINGIASSYPDYVKVITD